MRAPRPTVVAQALRQAAATLEDTGDQARLMATVLAARGYPSATLGNGSRSSDTTTSTERAVLNPDQWVGIDDRLTRLERTLWNLALNYATLNARIMAHASDDDPIPAGTGNCQRCERFCRPSAEKPNLRIKAGYCPSCYNRWLLAGRPDRSSFTRSVDDEDVA